MPNWVIERMLATSPRPGYVPGPEVRVPRDALESWVEQTRRFGIASILCLLGDDQLPLYRHAAPGGLLQYYRDSGFAVAHLPTLDGLTRPYGDAEYDLAWRHFQRLPKPVLVHCSAGMDRTYRVVDRILAEIRAVNGSLLDG
jgi:hypothetical protein